MNTEKKDNSATEWVVHDGTPETFPPIMTPVAVSFVESSSPVLLCDTEITRSFYGDRLECRWNYLDPVTGKKIRKQMQIGDAWFLIQQPPYEKQAEIFKQSLSSPYPEPCFTRP